jgi:carbonic anhydrase/acetyltransferase-like protein (isoleucine patch superfamily)
MKKYELTDDYNIAICGVTLHRIRAITNFGDIAAGDLGGYVEKEDNLSHNDNAWVRDNAKVFGNAEISGNAEVCGNAQVSDKAMVFGNARIFSNAKIYGNAQVSDKAMVFNNAWVGGNAKVSDNSWIYGNAKVSGNAKIYGDAKVSGNAEVCSNAKVSGNNDYATISGFGSAYRTTTFFKQQDGNIGVVCGCFYGTLGEFKYRVKKMYGNNKFAAEYLLIADLMGSHFLEKE